MAETKSMRVVPSGKIYRQLFEAQVQLNRSLVKIPRDQSTLKTSRGSTLIPLVHMSKDDLEHGLLGERSQTWVDGFPNDPYVENPVVYKQYAEYVGSQMKEPESSIEGREVRGLPDVVAPPRVGSNIIERIAASRKERHESAVEEMHQELSVINADMEPQIAQACEGLLKRLEEDDRDIASIQARFEKDEDLLLFPLDALHDLWKEIQGHSEVRQGWITDLDERLKKAEDDRMDMIKSVFQDYANNLEKIAHVMAPDLHRFMDKESQLVNQTVLSNRRAYGDLFVRLMSADIEREKSQHAHWKRRVEDWKMLKTELAIERFKKFMNDERVVSPPGVQKVMQFMVREQDMLNDKRLELINQLRDLTPPSSTKTSVYHWNKGVQDVSTEIDTTNQFQLANLHKEYESVCQNCLDEIENIKKELIETGVSSESRSKTVVEEFMIPLVGDRQRIYETNLEMMEKALEEHNKTTTEQLKSLFKYAQAAAHVWDVHEIGLARQERALQEKLEECRQQHDNQNQDKEAHLDIIMDRMRQDATEKALKDSLTRALEMLEKIRHTYEIFHKDQTNIVKQYPDMVKSELKNFDDALCRLFMVDRNKPAEHMEEEENGEPVGKDTQGVKEGEDGEMNADAVRSDLKVSFKNCKSKNNMNTSKALKGSVALKDRTIKSRNEERQRTPSTKKDTVDKKKSVPDKKDKNVKRKTKDNPQENKYKPDEVKEKQNKIENKPVVARDKLDEIKDKSEVVKDREDEIKDEPEVAEDNPCVLKNKTDDTIGYSDLNQAIGGDCPINSKEKDLIQNENMKHEEIMPISENVYPKNDETSDDSYKNDDKENKEIFPEKKIKALHGNDKDVKLESNLLGDTNDEDLSNGNDRERATSKGADISATRTGSEDGRKEGSRNSLQKEAAGINCADNLSLKSDHRNKEERDKSGTETIHAKSELEELGSGNKNSLILLSEIGLPDDRSKSRNEKQTANFREGEGLSPNDNISRVPSDIGTKDERSESRSEIKLANSRQIIGSRESSMCNHVFIHTSPEGFRARTDTAESRSEHTSSNQERGESRSEASVKKKSKIEINERRGSASSVGSNLSEDGTGKGKKKPFPMKPAQKKESKDLPSAVNEVLSTKKGTTFYVLTVAGEHGIPADEPETPSNEKAPAGASAFMTEVSGLSTESDGRPDYLKSIDVKDSLLNEIKRQIRINFLNHLEEWIDQAGERAQSVVVAKCEELNSELDLRLHLHKPRARRAEYDVHNVRAAELVMHSERVTRHCKGIQQALTEVRNRLTSMTSEHNNLAQKFRQDIESLEVVFINATKASRLYGLKNQLNLELDKFMSVIRASLRQFRQHLDETLQMLRESNARFIKSFKVFSDGGNFCPEEIEEYRKRLDKMANNIDKAEGSIMSDLEDMESKRLEQATKVAMEFEDRFKNHLFDLIFMEKIARWLTNTQVKIKGEVANSNTQAQRLGQHLLDIDRRIDACERPNLDKEQITSHQLNDSLRGVFEAFKARSVYLDCLKNPSLRPPSGNVQTQGARVGFAQESGPTPISKAGKQPSEDPSVNVIKGIMKSNKSKLRFGMDAALDGDLNPSPEGREKMKSSMSTAASSERGKVSRHGGPSPSNNEGTMRKAQSAATSNCSESRTSDLLDEDIEGNRRSSKPTRYEKKTVIFGDVSPEEEDNLTHFLGIIRKSLKEALDGLLSSAEMYYRQKGTRPVTRPQALQETFEQCADVIVQKLQSYFQQADEYHNQCLQEFRSQLQSLEKGVAHIPDLVVSDLLEEEIALSQRARRGYEAQFIETQTDLEKRQEEHKQLLRPGLGHPHQKPQLEALCQQETDRHNEYVSAVEEHAKTLQTSAETHAKQFVEALSQLSESQLVQYDDMLVIDDVEKGRVEAKKYPTTELIRRKNAGEPLEDDEDKDALPRGRGTWPGVPMNELVSGEIPSKPQLMATVTTAKTTLGHSATVTARDNAFKEYKGQFMKTLQEIEEEKQRLLVAEQRWMDSWNTSVDKVKKLYQ